MILQYFFYALFLIGITACTTTEAPVVDGWKQNKSETSDYRVEAGDTVYSVAWAFAMDYRDIVKLNHLREPYTLHAGQRLRMLPGQRISSSTTKPTHLSLRQTTKSLPQNTSPPPTKLAPPPSPVLGVGLWPTEGKIIRGFSPSSGGNKGIDIAGKLGQPVVTTATGKVVYTGASLPGYGNLIIIKHTDNTLSAYAFNKVIAIKEGQMVMAGQMIAKMGKNEAGKAALHFEIREGGKPVDPMPFLRPQKPSSP